MALQTTIAVKGVPIEGGAVTVRDTGLLKMGQFSMVQNVKALHPGFRKRKGQVKQHSTINATYSTSELMSAFQLKKTRNVENIYLVQSSDGDVQSLTTAPPGITPGDMGTVVYSGTASPKPASWSNLQDMLLYSCSVDQHLLYPATTSYVSKFVKYTEGGNPINSNKAVLDGGFDYTEEVTDGQTSTVAILDSLDVAANGDGILICTPVPATSLTFTVSAVNGTVSTATLYYWKNDASWAAISTGWADGTKTGGNTTLGQSGAMSWTPLTDSQERYLFGRAGYWYLLVVSVALDAEVEISSVTYGSGFNELKSLWDAVPVSAPLVLVDNANTGTVFDSYSGEAVDIDSLADASKIYIFSTDPIEGLYLDPGATPDADAQTLLDIHYWNGTAWTDLTILNDGSEGINHAGWVLFNRAAAQPRHMDASSLYGYWYQLEFDDAVAADVVISIGTMPYFDIHDWGYYGQCNVAWKERALWTFSDKWPEYVYISAVSQPQVLVGIDSGIIEVGDGRPHKVVAMKNFFNNVLVFQEEKGEIGGCVTMLQGYDVPTFGKLVLSTKVGTMNAKSVDVVENVYTSTATKEELATVAFFLSRYGVIACDGNGFSVISDDIQNYFDPNDANCIRTGYESEMWLKHDPIDHVIRIGLVCGASATTPNVFPVYDLITRQWYFDVRGQNLSFWENVEAGSGTSPWAQIAGGVNNGQLYVVNTGTADVSTAIDTFVTIEFPGHGQYLDLMQFLLTCKAQTGDITLTPYGNGIAGTAITLSMVAERTNDLIRRHLLSTNFVDQHVSVKIQNSSASASMTLMAIGAEIKLWLNR